jgi:hypothetical protein
MFWEKAYNIEPYLDSQTLLQTVRSLIGTRKGNKERVASGKLAGH